MATNPLVQLGTLNRLIGTVHFQNHPELNVTASNLAPEGIDMALEDEAVTFLRAMTGMVTSPEPYQGGAVAVHIVRTQSLADSWREQLLSNALLGPMTVYPDVTTFGPFDFDNCGIRRVDPLPITGKDLAWVIHLYGTFYENAEMWNQFTASIG